MNIHLNDNNGIKINNKITNNAAALQHKDAIRVFSITLDQNFAFGPFHLDNNVTYQYSSNQTVLPLPTISTYNNLYFNFKIAKVLKTEVGADMKFFTEYYAPDYSPVIGQFTTQNPDKLVKIGGHPLISAYANFELKRLRFYIQYYHANAGTSRAFWGPGYPMNPSGIHFGLSWNFYDYHYSHYLATLISRCFLSKYKNIFTLLCHRKQKKLLSLRTNLNNDTWERIKY